MAKKDVKDPKFEWKGYVNIDIPEKLESKLESFAADDKAIYFRFNQLITTNYTIKFYYDDHSEAIKATATCFQHDDPNFGYALSAFAEDWLTALAVLLFKHDTLAQGDWNTVASKKIRRFG